MDIIVEPNQILHQPTQPVVSFDSDLEKTVAEMRKTMLKNRGMGLAAPQVNLDMQLAIIEFIPEKEGDSEEVPFTVLINPTIVWSSGREIVMTEGCLSVPGFEGEVSRPRRIKIKSQDLFGNQIVIKASGLGARIMQHEIDHLKGILFTEKLVPGTELRVIGPKI